jgi:hypothetical protein
MLTCTPWPFSLDQSDHGYLMALHDDRAVFI